MYECKKIGGGGVFVYLFFLKNYDILIENVKKLFEVMWYIGFM